MKSSFPAVPRRLGPLDPRVGKDGQLKNGGENVGLTEVQTKHRRGFRLSDLFGHRDNGFEVLKGAAETPGGSYTGAEAKKE